MIDYEAILNNLDIQYWTSGKNNVAGCLTIKCPCCDDHSRHGNLDPQTGSYSCWRCKGNHPVVVLQKASGRPKEYIEKLIKDYTTGEVKVETKKVYAKELDIPGARNPLPIHVNYLQGRGLSPADLELLYGIRYGRLGEMAGSINVSLRIIIPVLDECGTPISWQGRDATGKSELRYVFPPSSATIGDSKKHLYGAHLCTKRTRIVVVEGVFDAWKLGPGAVCTFGTSVTAEQISIMSRWEEVVIAFDNEPEAQQHAREIALRLAPCGVKVFIAPPELGYNLDGTARDLGDATPEEIKEFREYIGLN